MIAIINLLFIDYVNHKSLLYNHISYNHYPILYNNISIITKVPN